MIKVNKDNIVQVAAQNWKELYFRDGAWATYTWRNENAEDIYKKLVKAKTANEFDEIVGNGSWTVIHCDECEEFSSEGVVFENNLVGKHTLCLDCLNKAVKL